MYVHVYICIYVVCMYVCMHICIISFICVDKITFEQAHNFFFLPNTNFTEHGNDVVTPQPTQVTTAAGRNSRNIELYIHKAIPLHIHYMLLYELLKCTCSIALY